VRTRRLHLVVRRLIEDRGRDWRCRGSSSARDRCDDVAEATARCEGSDMITVSAGIRVLVSTHQTGRLPSRGRESRRPGTRAAPARSVPGGTIDIFRSKRADRLKFWPGIRAGVVLEAVRAPSVPPAADQRWRDDLIQGPGNAPTATTPVPLATPVTPAPVRGHNHCHPGLERPVAGPRARKEYQRRLASASYRSNS
jgi:hypothetical protein